MTERYPALEYENENFKGVELKHLLRLAGPNAYPLGCFGGKTGEEII